MNDESLGGYCALGAAVKSSVRSHYTYVTDVLVTSGIRFRPSCMTGRSADCSSANSSLEKIFSYREVFISESPSREAKMSN